jgi:hypothetical protein
MKRINVSVDDAEHAAISAYAKTLALSESAAARELLRRALAELKRQRFLADCAVPEKARKRLDEIEKGMVRLRGW